MTLADDLATRSQTMGTQVVSNMSRWYSNGVWLGDLQSIWPFNTFTPAALLATLVKFGAANSATYLQMIRETMARVEDTALGNGLAYNTPGFLTLGGYPRLPSTYASHVIAGDPQLEMYDYYMMGPTRQSMQGLTPSDFGVDMLNCIESCHPLAFMISQLPTGSITTAERAKWTSWCQAMCDFLDRPNGLTYFYVNGNYQARLCQAYWYTSMISAPGVTQEKYRDMYERALLFMIDPALISPGSSGWAGYGWHKQTTGEMPDWSDYTGYLTESYPNDGGSGPGMDWGYSVVQCEALAGIFLMNRDERVLRLLNAISLKLEPRWDQTRWVLDGSNGSRQGGNNYGQSVSYPFIQALLARKRTNTSMLTPTKLLDYWDHSTNGDGGVTNGILVRSANEGFYGGFSEWYTTLALTREAAYQARIKVPAV